MAILNWNLIWNYIEFNMKLHVYYDIDIASLAIRQWYYEWYYKNIYINNICKSNI